MFLKNKQQTIQPDPLRAKLSALKDKLGELNAKQEFSAGENGSRNTSNNETISDDGDLDNGAKELIKRDEVIVREALQLVGVDYDALIDMEPVERDGVQALSPYAQAVQANPAVLDQVLNSERPVLAALQVALGFKPYAEFTQKYGDDPQKIRDAIRDEMKGELSATVEKEKPQGNGLMATPFSSSKRSGKGKNSTFKPKSLGEIFKK